MLKSLSKGTAGVVLAMCMALAGGGVGVTFVVSNMASANASVEVQTNCGSCGQPIGSGGHCGCS